MYGFEENAFKVNGISYHDEHMVLHLRTGKGNGTLKVKISVLAIINPNLSEIYLS